MSTTTLHVDSVTLVAPEDWVQLPVEPVPDAEVPAVLGTVLTARRGVHPQVDPDAELTAVVGLQRRLAARAPQALAVWVPAPPAPPVAAALVVDLLVPDAAGALAWEDLVAQVADAPPAPGEDREWRLVHVLDDVPWGRAVMAHEVASVGGGPPEERLTYLVQPHGSADVLRLAFATPYPELGEGLRERTVAVLLHLEVDLVPAP